MSAALGSAELAGPRERLRAALDAEPGGLLEDIARREEASYRAVLDALAPDGAVEVAGAPFAEIWAELADWPGAVTLVVHTADGVFETKGAVPPGTYGRGYFNVHGDSPIGGHLRADRCAAIFLVDRVLFGRRSCSVQFVNADGDAMFKIFVGRTAAREMDPAQLARFDALTARYRGISADRNG